MQTECEVERPETPAATRASVSVEIYDQIYHLRGVDPGAIEQLAATVDAKMRAVSAHGGTVDSLRVAVLAALNLADELTMLRHRYELLADSIANSEISMRSRAGSLSGMLDELLDGSSGNQLEIRRAG